MGITRVGGGLLLVLASAMAFIPALADDRDFVYRMHETAGTQAVLLEARGDGTLTPESYAGTATWERGTELGQPVILGRATVPLRGMTAILRIRPNTDPTLPATHIIEVAFEVAPGFDGDPVAQLRGVLVKDEAPAQGKALNGAAARVIQNTFLFAVSQAARADENAEQIQRRLFLDLAIVYESGRRAIVTFEKDAAAMLLCQFHQRSIFINIEPSLNLQRHVAPVLHT